MKETEFKRRNPLKFLLVLGFASVVLLLVLLASSAGKQAANAAPLAAQSADGVWQDVAEAGLRIEGDRVIVPTAYRVVSLDWGALNSLLEQAPASLNGATEVVLSLPLPDGTYGRFQISQSSVMHPELAAKFPEIQTFTGVGIDDPTASVRLDSTPKGFHAMILSGNGRVFIDPYANDNIGLYQSYYANDFVPNLPEDFDPDIVVENPDDTFHAEEGPAINGVFSSGAQLRTYRLAVAATGEYTQFHGGTVPLAMAEIVTAINRVSGIYEREVAVSFELIPNNDLIVYTNGATDPYTNGSGGAMLGQNQSNLNSVIGSPNYDVGHVFSTGGGGIASLGVICGGSKAQGVTGLSAPVGDPFYVDYVAHEMGHQFAGNHTFNGNAGSCGGFNRNGSTAYEPGSGTTIMAYAGICSPQNIQNNSDDYFHGISFDEIVSFTTSGLGNSCPIVTSTGNTPPVVDAGASYSIPLNTPFTLTGTGSDVDGTASLTYQWEEFDLGPTGAPTSPSGNAPIFRSFSPTTSPARTFPQISDIVNNTQTLGEILPSYGRTMNFRFTIRDNQVPAGGVASDETTVTAVAGTGPFLVTAPNTAVTWTGNTSEAVSWNVAGTTAAPISCANVDIELSTDGGFTYPTVLEANTPNDGSSTVLVPNISTSTARVRVSCANNIFFDISNANFSIVPGGGPTVTPSNTPVPTTVTATATATATATPVLPTITPTITATPSASPTPGPGGQTLTFNPIADAFTMANRPTSNLGGASTLRLDASPDANSYLRFDVQGLTGPVSQATLRLYVQSSSSQGYDVHQVANNSWGESSINYNNAPALGSVINSSGATTANNFVDVDVTSYVTSNGLISFGANTADTSLILLSSREGGNPPELVIQTVGGPTPTPTNTGVPPTATNTPTPTSTPGAGGSTFTFASNDDATVLSSRPTINFGAASILATDDAPDVLSFLKFNVAGLDGPVASATLRVFVTTAAAPFDVAQVADNGWSQASITYSNAPTVGATINGSGSISGGTWVEIDVTSAISGDGTFSLALLADGAGRNLFDSAETGNGPELVVVTGP